jgi:hypothetical protein
MTCYTHCKSCRTEWQSQEYMCPDFDSSGRIILVQCDCGGVIEAGFLPDNIFIADIMGGGRQFESTHWSEAMAISPSQIEAHKKLWPDVPVRPDGVVGFNSVQQQDKYMQDTGFVKHPQKLRPVATR